MTPFIETFLGEHFQPLAPVPSTIFIEDIAHALSNQCRFSGHSREFYSVGQHSVHVSELLEEWGEDEDVQLWGLLHDASEAYLVDLPTPLKQSAFGKDYRRAEAVLMMAICDRFGMARVQPERVFNADVTMLATEARDLMPFKPAHWGELEVRPREERIDTWMPKVAEFRFLERFRWLDGRR